MKKNKSFFKKNKIYLIIGTLLIVWVCFVVFVIFPSVKLLKSDYDGVQMKLIDVQNNDNKLSKLDVLKDNFEKVNSEKKYLETIFHSDDIVGLARELEAIAQKTENSIIISVDEDNKKMQEMSKGKSNTDKNSLLELLPAKNYFTIKIFLIGDYNGLIKFTDKLNNLKYYNNIVSFKIASKKVAIEETSNNRSSTPSSGISVLGGSTDIINKSKEEEKEKLVLSSELDVIFYSLEKNDGKK